MKNRENGTQVTNYRPMPIEQKGCGRNARVTKDQLLIDQMIFIELSEKENRIGNGLGRLKQGNWFLEIFGVAENIRNLLLKSKNELKAGNNSLGSVDLKRRIFQGNGLSPFSIIMSNISADYE